MPRRLSPARSASSLLRARRPCGSDAEAPRTAAARLSSASIRARSQDTTAHAACRRTLRAGLRARCASWRSGLGQRLGVDDAAAICSPRSLGTHFGPAKRRHSMPADSNTTLVIAKIEEGWNARRLAVFDELCASGMVDHSVPPGLPQTRDGTKQLAALYWTAFPNLRLTIEDQIADSDTVVTRWTARGTHTGELMGLAPTGKPVIVTRYQHPIVWSLRQDRRDMVRSTGRDAPAARCPFQRLLAQPLANSRGPCFFTFPWSTDW